MSSIDSYEYRETDTGRTGEDKKGRYKIINVYEEEPCNCHPETCCHLDQTISSTYEKHVYIPIEEGIDYDEVKWMSTGNSTTIGMVTRTDKITGEKFLYISDVPGKNEKKDIKFILEWGCKYSASSIIAMLTT